MRYLLDAGWNKYRRGIVSIEQRPRRRAVRSGAQWWRVDRMSCRTESRFTSAALASVLIGAVCAQTAPPKFRFEVASIRPSRAADSTNRMGPTPQGGLRGENVTPLQLIAVACGVRPFLIVDAPGWASAERFDVIASPDVPDVLPAGATPVQRDELRDRFRQRVHALLAERFGLVIRQESRPMPVLKLVVARGGHKLTPAADTDSRRMQSNPTMLEGHAVDMKAVADSLSGLLLQPIIDETNLAGAFNFSMRFADVRPGRAPDASAVDAAPTIYTAIAERLGLRLESARAPVPVFVVQKLQRPSEN
jgi:uncharacterized protein (TIGR03435 family)